MIRIIFKEMSLLPFREWDIENGLIVRCEPDPDVSWIGVEVPLNEKDLFSKPFSLNVDWADGTCTPLDIDCMIRLPSDADKDESCIRLPSSNARG